MLQVNSIFSDEGLGQYCALDYQVNYLKEMLCFVLLVDILIVPSSIAGWFR